MQVVLDRPWLIADLGRPRRVLSWAPHRPGFVTASRIVWREVKNADLPLGFDVEDWFAGALRASGQGEAVAMLTSRDIATYRLATAEVDGLRADCVATVGLSNAESVGARLPWHAADFGTINIAVSVQAGMTEAAQLEALAIAVQARTAAVLAAGVELATGMASGTGTDCIALAADAGDMRHAGLHTAAGEAVGRAVREAVARGAEDWLRERAALRAREG